MERAGRLAWATTTEALVNDNDSMRVWTWPHKTMRIPWNCKTEQLYELVASFAPSHFHISFPREIYLRPWALAPKLSIRIPVIHVRRPRCSRLKEKPAPFCLFTSIFTSFSYTQLLSKNQGPHSHIHTHRPNGKMKPQSFHLLPFLDSGNTRFRDRDSTQRHRP